MAHHIDLDPLRLTAVSPDAPEQVAELAALAEETFIEAYADKIDATVLVPYAKDVLAPDLREALARGGADAFWVRNSAAVAYATVRLPSATERSTTIHLDRIYIRESNRRQGLGRLLVDEAVSVGRRAGMTRICLGVWEVNTPASLRLDEDSEDQASLRHRGSCCERLPALRGLLHGSVTPTDRLTSCQAGRMSLCRSPIRRSSARMWSGWRGTGCVDRAGCSRLRDPPDHAELVAADRRC